MKWLNALVLWVIVISLVHYGCKKKGREEQPAESVKDTVSQVDTAISVDSNSVGSEDSEEESVPPKPKLVVIDRIDTVKYGKYRFVWGFKTKRELLRKFYIYKGDSLIDSVIYFRLLDRKGDTLIYTSPVQLVNLDGRGRKELVVYNYTGSATGAGESFDVFELRNGKLVPTQGFISYAPVVRDIKDIDGDGIPEILMNNDLFVCYDATCEGCMPKFTSYLHYRNGRFYDVSRRFRYLYRKELKKFKTKYLAWRDSVLSSSKSSKIFAKPYDDGLKGDAVKAYLYYYLSGAPRYGVQFIKKHVPEEYEWFLEHKAEIDSMLIHWPESAFIPAKMKRYYPSVDDYRDWGENPEF